MKDCDNLLQLARAPALITLSPPWAGVVNPMTVENPRMDRGRQERLLLLYGFLLHWRPGVHRRDFRVRDSLFGANSWS